MSCCYYVYSLRLESNPTPFYIGKGKGNRFKNHFSEKKITNPIKTGIINRAKREGIPVLIEKIADGIDEELAFLVEVEAIQKYGKICDKTGCLSNLTDGGEGGQTLLSKESKRKFAESMARVNATKEVQLKRSESARAMWENPETKTAIMDGKEKFFKSDAGKLAIKSHRFNSWTNAYDKWILAPEIYDIWIENDKCAYKKLSTILVGQGYPQFHLQKMIKYFTTTSPLEDKEYLEWRSLKEN